MKHLKKEERISFILGCVLGDGCLSGKTNKYFSGGHSEKQLEYLKWKMEIISKNFNVTYKIKENKSLKTPNRNIFYQSWTTSHHTITSIYRRVYINNKKNMTKWAIDRLTPLGIAILFMDDGCKETRKNKNGEKRIISYKFSLNSFEIKDIEYFQEHLLEKYNISSKLYLDRGKYPIVKITTIENREKFYNLIFPFMHPSMMYKLNL